MTRPIVFAHPRMLDHQPGPRHPERPDRLRAIDAALADAPIERRAATPATRTQLGRVHPSRYVDALLSLDGREATIDADTHTSSGSIPAALLAAGAGVQAVDALLAGEAKRAFGLVRPPGHHAEPGTPMGFCLFNNVAVAAEHALSHDGVERVMIIDWDVHHGNGTQAAFYGREDVCFFSAHQSPLYPGTGALAEIGRGAGAGHTVNAPLPPGLGDGDYQALFDDVVRPVADRFRPDLVLVSAGFDAHRSDPLGGMMLSEEGFAGLCATVQDIADTHAAGRLLLMLEGGYDLVGLARSVRSCVEVMAGATPPERPAGPGARAAEAIAAVKATGLAG